MVIVKGRLQNTDISLHIDDNRFQYKQNPPDHARTPDAKEWRQKGKDLIKIWVYSKQPANV